METDAFASEVANYSIYQLKNRVEQIREMTQEEQIGIRDIIEDAALHILSQNMSAPKGA